MTAPQQHPRGSATEGLPRLFTPEELGNALGRSGWWVRQQAREQRFPHVRIGGRGSIAFTTDHVEEIVRGMERPALAGPEPVPARTRRNQGQHRTTSTAPASELRARPPRRARKGGNSSD